MLKSNVLVESILLDWCLFRSSIISGTDLCSPNVEIIWGKSTLSWGSDSGSFLSFANRISTSLCGLSELKWQSKKSVKIDIIYVYICNKQNKKIEI